MAQWFDGGAADGFVIPTFLPASIHDFAADVVPELQRRDLIRTCFEACTLREILGPPSRQLAHAKSRARCS
jgi:hypothetical protein